MRRLWLGARNAEMSSGPKLLVAWCSRKAAAYACRHWHYTRRMNGCFKQVYFGVWEDDEFVGAIIFGCGSTLAIGSPFGIQGREAAELLRVTLKEHKSHVSQMIRFAIKLLRDQCPKLRILVSYADSSEGHHGGIYQAGNWIYLGAKSSSSILFLGELVHAKTLHTKYGTSAMPWLRSHVDPNARWIVTLPKHKYVMPLDDDMRKQIEPLRKPYPKRVGSDTSDTPADQAGKGGAAPTPALAV